MGLPFSNLTRLRKAKVMAMKVAKSSNEPMLFSVVTRLSERLTRDEKGRWIVSMEMYKPVHKAHEGDSDALVAARLKSADLESSKETLAASHGTERPIPHDQGGMIRIDTNGYCE